MDESKKDNDGTHFKGWPNGRAERDRLVDQFCKWDGRSRPPSKAYDEGWERIFGPKDSQK
jgi:hypothetical protein